MSTRSPHSQRGAVSKGCLLGFGIAALLGLVLLWIPFSQYNKLVDRDERVEQQWAALESDYKRRLDLIPQLVATVKGASDFEQDTLTAVTEARAKVSQLNLGDDVAGDPAKLEQFMNAQGQLGSALSRLLVTVEAYPQLRATDAYRDLQSQVEGTENRIAVGREDYIAAVREYNTAVRRFPTNLVAGIMGFETRPQLQQEAGVRETPVIDFGDG